MSFIELCLSGDALLDEIDIFVENWHEGVEGADQELDEFLGMNQEEYSLWAVTPSILPHIIAARKRGCTIDEELTRERYALAARASTPEEAIKIEKWLRRIGKLA